MQRRMLLLNVILLLQTTKDTQPVCTESCRTLTATWLILKHCQQSRSRLTTALRIRLSPANTTSLMSSIWSDGVLQRTCKSQSTIHESQGILGCTQRAAFDILLLGDRGQSRLNSQTKI